MNAPLQDQLRQLLLGQSIYTACSLGKIVPKQALETRLSFLQENGCFANSMVKDLVGVCKLRQTTEDKEFLASLPSNSSCLHQSEVIRIRKLLLGPVVYKSCNFSKTAVPVSVLKSRLSQLQAQGCMEGQTVDDLITVCGLKETSKTPTLTRCAEPLANYDNYVSQLFSSLPPAYCKARTTEDDLQTFKTTKVLSANMTADLEDEETLDCLESNVEVNEEDESCMVCGDSSRVLFNLHAGEEDNTEHSVCRPDLIEIIGKANADRHPAYFECPVCRAKVDTIKFLDFYNLGYLQPQIDKAAVRALQFKARDIQQQINQQTLDLLAAQQAEQELANKINVIRAGLTGGHTTPLNDQEKSFYNNNSNNMIEIQTVLELPLYDTAITSLLINYSTFNDSISNTSLSASIQVLFIYSNVFNQPIENFTHLNNLIIHSTDFNQPLNNLPALKSIIMDSANYNQPLLDLPSLSDLTIISQAFNQPLENFEYLTNLTIISPVFNQPLTALPSLKELTIISQAFDHPLYDLPALERLIIISQSFNQTLSFPSLYFLNLKSPVFNQSLTNLAKILSGLHIESLVFDQPVRYFKFLEEITITSPIFNQPLKNMSKLFNIEINSDTYNYPISNLPLLSFLSINSKKFNQPLLDLPSLSDLTINSPAFNHPINRSILPLLEAYKLNYMPRPIFI